MKVGIMSMQRVINYGSFLQAYGLKSVIEGMGHSVEFVDYLPQPSLVPAEAVPFQRQVRNKIKNLFRMISPAYREYRSKQIKMNQTYYDFSIAYEQHFLPQLGVSYSRNYCPELDVLVIGSDEVFNCTQPGDLVGYSLQLFGKDHRAKKLVSYAASFGSTTMEKLTKYDVAEEIGKYLKSFDVLSVRDNNSAQIINALCDLMPTQHIDPVLLYDFPEVNDIDIGLQDYMVVYAYAGRIQDAEAEAIRKFANRYHKKILCLGYYQPFCDEYVLASPVEALAYIKHADYVVTDTFHGTVFSIKYQVPFAVIIRDSNQQKLEDLLSRFQLENRRLTELDLLERVLRTPMDNQAVHRLLSKYQNVSNEYLRDVLHGL